MDSVAEMYDIAERYEDLTQLYINLCEQLAIFESRDERSAEDERAIAVDIEKVREMLKEARREVNRIGL